MDSNRPEYILGKSLDAMSTANLQELLQAELDSEQDVDVAKVKKILAVLDERTEPKEVDVDAAWERFFHNHLPSEPIVSMPEDTPTRKKSSRRKHCIRIGLIAALIAVFCLGAGVTASAAGFNILDAVMQWSSETFGFSYNQNNDTSSIQTNPEYYGLKEALARAGVSEPMIPNYLPDGYKQVEFSSNGEFFVAVYVNNDSTIVIQIQKISADNLQNEKDAESPDIYFSGETKFYISTNTGTYVAAWTSAGYECSIYGVETRQELIKMIDSIGMEDIK